MAGWIVISLEKCVGCRSCEAACSLGHEGTCAPSRARIHVQTNEREITDTPVLCLQCEEAACARVCKAEAISLNRDTGAYEVDPEKCTACKRCVKNCPYGCIKIDTIAKKAIKCDLCQGNPRCVEFCPTGALTFEEPSPATSEGRKSMAEKFKSFREVVK